LIPWTAFTGGMIPKRTMKVPCSNFKIVEHAGQAVSRPSFSTPAIRGVARGVGF